MLRSTPSGRFGFVCGSSPLAIRSVQSAKYLKGAPPRLPASWVTICSPAWPDWMRRIHASSWFANLPSDSWNVRVEIWPS